MGPVANKAQFDKIQGMIQKGIDEGAKLEAGGTGRPDGLGIGAPTRCFFEQFGQPEQIEAEEFGSTLYLTAGRFPSVWIWDNENLNGDRFIDGLVDQITLLGL